MPNSRLEFEVIIIGAGISGLNTAYRLQNQFPDLKYTILEARTSLGGTWDLFRYPGIRSDSDLFTFGFSWHPWTASNPIAEASAIKEYLRNAISKHGITERILYEHNVDTVRWSRAENMWYIDTIHLGEPKTFKSCFIVFGTGYYDYKEPLRTEIPGLDSFKGSLIHPQFWPEDLDYRDKRVVVIGSGATAITVVPKLAEDASEVTMLQRSPSYILSLPNRRIRKSWLAHLIPTAISAKINRILKLISSRLFFLFCRTFPNSARRMIRRATIRKLPEHISYDVHFNPKYKPWDQRLCVCPDGDFFKSLHKGNVQIKTDTIKQISASGIELTSGEFLHADIIVAATGLKIQFAGGIRILIDSERFYLNEKFMWKGMMMQDLPNAALVIGYTNNSWTLGADVTGILLCRLLKYLKKRNGAAIIPRVPKSMHLEQRRMLELSSTYISKAEDELPRTAHAWPWQPRNNYLLDIIHAMYGRVDEALEVVG